MTNLRVALARAVDIDAFWHLHAAGDMFKVRKVEKKDKNVLKIAVT
jgi:hypothetical protein